MAQLDFYNRDMGMYNNQIAVFSNGYQDFKNWYIRNHMPMQPKKNGGVTLTITPATEMETTRDMISAFGGYNHTMNCGETVFYMEKNMTSDYYPDTWTPRRKRRRLLRILKEKVCVMMYAGKRDSACGAWRLSIYTQRN